MELSRAAPDAGVLRARGTKPMWRAAVDAWSARRRGTKPMCGERITFVEGGTMRPPMASTFRVVFVAALAVVFAPTSAWAQKKVALKLNLKAGESYTLTATSKRQSSVTFGGLARKESETAAVTVTLKPKEVDKDGTVH